MLTNMVSMMPRAKELLDGGAKEAMRLGIVVFASQGMRESPSNNAIVISMRAPGRSLTLIFNSILGPVFENVWDCLSKPL